MQMRQTKMCLNAILLKINVLWLFITEFLINSSLKKSSDLKANLYRLYHNDIKYVTRYSQFDKNLTRTDFQLIKLRYYLVGKILTALPGKYLT